MTGQGMYSDKSTYAACCEDDKRGVTWPSGYVVLSRETLDDYLDAIRGPAYRRALRRLRHQQDAEDAVAIALIKLVEHYGKYGSLGDDPYAYAAGVVRNAVIDVLRSRSRQRKHERSLYDTEDSEGDPYVVDVPDLTKNVEDAYADEEDLDDRLKYIAERLTPIQRRLLYCDYRDVSANEAVELGVCGTAASYQAALSRVYRRIATLSKRWEEAHSATSVAGTHR